MIDIMKTTGIIVLVHGIRGERGSREVETTLQKITSGLKYYFPQQTEITGAALQFNQPSLEDAVDMLAARNVTRIIIAPYFLFTGLHITEHVPEAIDELRKKHQAIEFILSDIMGMDNSFIGHLAMRIARAAPDIIERSSDGKANSIENESMQIIDNLLPPLKSISAKELQVIKRIVHASGDVDVASLVKFGNRAIDSGIAAIKTGQTIFTDVRMVMAGIDKRLAVIFSCNLLCSLDLAEGTQIQTRPDMTRAEISIRQLGSMLNNSIIAIGNAPTALLSLLELIDDNHVMPALVIGMPVGFVKAAESKQELVKRNIPFITVTGTRGGSAMAASTVNALLRMASFDK